MNAHITPVPGQSVLLVEDSATLATAYGRILTGAGFAVRTASSGAAALEELERRPAVVALDLGLPDMDGMAILRQIQSRGGGASVVVITSNASLGTAIAAMREGAYDYLVKPFSAERLAATMRSAMGRATQHAQLPEVHEGSLHACFQGFIGASPEMQAVYKTIASAARSNATVFITGESGTGKEVCAAALHAESARAGKPFIAINCAAIPHDLMESEIFGHIAGAFTGATTDRAGAAELADGGTIFFDEMCEMDINLQAKLLRLLQSGAVQRVGAGKVRNVDIRVVCATNRDPLQEVAAGRFREDLFYRLHVIPVHLPALRTRGEDISLLASALLEKFAKAEGRKFTSLSADALAAIMKHDWPGNVRELQNAIHNAVVLNDGPVLEAQMLPGWVTCSAAIPASKMRQPLTMKVPISGSGNGRHAIVPLWQMEKQAILAAIEACEGNLLKAAAALEISVSTIYRKKLEWTSASEAAE